MSKKIWAVLAIALAVLLLISVLLLALNRPKIENALCGTSNSSFGVSVKDESDFDKGQILVFNVFNRSEHEFKSNNDGTLYQLSGNQRQKVSENQEGTSLDVLVNLSPKEVEIIRFYPSITKLEKGSYVYEQSFTNSSTNEISFVWMSFIVN